jgi:Undecaprenyl-phosphate glucose phosphotransferase
LSGPSDHESVPSAVGAAVVPPGGYWSPNRVPSLESIPAPSQVAASRKFRSRFRVIGTYSDIPALIEQGGIDQLIVALPLKDHDKLESVIASIGDAMIDVRIVPDFHQFIQLGSQVEDFDGVPVVSLASTPLSGINRVTKRIFDVVVGLILCLISIPIIAVCAALIKFSSRGPVFFTQERVGLDGRRFKIFKLRTMSLDAEKDGAKFAVKGDPRVTLIGRVLRRLSIDELPQLINVILGQMSLVGPRPERPVFIEEFRRHFPRYMLRHKVQAGMTGWAQVNGWRGNTSIERRIEHDLFYIENWSLLLDVKILARTVVSTILDRNAY